MSNKIGQFIWLLNWLVAVGVYLYGAIYASDTGERVILFFVFMIWSAICVQGTRKCAND